jgi:hypothetical protein
MGMRAKGFRARVIAAELNRTVDAIYSFLRYVPCKPGQRATMKATEPCPIYWSADEFDAMRRMAEDGASAAEVAFCLCRPLSGVRSQASREKVRFGNRGKRSDCRVEREGNHYKRDAIEGSTKLLNALLELAA